MCASLVMLLALFNTAFNSKLTDDLARQFEVEDPNQKISCLVYMKQTYPYEAIDYLPVKERIASFRRIAKESQAPVLAYLLTIPSDAKVVQTFWVMNGFYLLAKSKVILNLAQRDDIAWISHNGTVQITGEPMPLPTPASATAIEWNIQRVMADSCWVAGYTGCLLYTSDAADE